MKFSVITFLCKCFNWRCTSFCLPLQARLWVQVVRELRRGVQLKKVCYNRKPIEFELTPYEILMDDIRSRRYKLNKVMVDGNIPHKVKKDAHAVILEFIRSRPPLRKVRVRYHHWSFVGFKLDWRGLSCSKRRRTLETLGQ